MSFASTASSAVSGGLNTMLAAAPRTLRAASRSAGIMLTAATMAVLTQIAAEETRFVLQSFKSRAAERRDQKVKIVMNLAASGLSLTLQDKIRGSRDALKTVLAMLTDPKGTLSETDHKILRDAVEALQAGHA